MAQIKDYKMKKIILMTMLMSAVFAQSDCNKDNWREYYNSEGRDLTNCDLERKYLAFANLTGANLTGANLREANLRRARLREADLRDAILKGVRSSRIKGKPAYLPKGWSLVDGRLINKNEE